MTDENRSLRKKSLKSIIAFIDWNSQRKRFASDLVGEDLHSIEYDRNVLEKSISRISTVLYNNFNELKFSVAVRLYGGWHDGRRPTRWRENINRICESDFSTLSSRPNVVFKNLNFGDRSLSALDSRLFDSFPCHYPGTLRRIKSKGGGSRKARGGISLKKKWLILRSYRI